MTAVALSMDAFAVSVCKGLATDKVRLKHMLICGAWFGGFQALMPLIGFLLGQTFQSYITPVDHWITFALLAFIGFNMLKEALGDEEEADSSLGFKIMLTMALATSIDALAVGIGFAMIEGINIVFAIASIGVITFLLSAVGVKIGQVFGSRWRAPAEFAGGLVLIGIGLKILIEHILADKKAYDLLTAQVASLILSAFLAILCILNLKKSGRSKTDKAFLLLYAVSSAVLFLSGIATLIIYFAVV